MSAPHLPDAVTDFDFSPFDPFLLATGSADEMVSARCRAMWLSPAYPCALLWGGGRWVQMGWASRV